MQVRLATPLTSEQYISEQGWRRATVSRCPWHPQGGCGFCRHGSYARREPAGIRIARWYCPTAQHTLSALPDFLCSHRRGTLAECEAIVLIVEHSPSLISACDQVRTDIQLPGAVRFIRRLQRDIYGLLTVLCGLLPQTFTSCTSLRHLVDHYDGTPALPTLRVTLASHLHQLPCPVGFNPHYFTARSTFSTDQQWTGPDPPCAFVDAS